MSDTLAVDGGTPVRSDPMPTRALLGAAERDAAMAVFDEAVRTGTPFGYGGRPEQSYCEAFAAYLGGGYADGVNSGTNALFVALGALQLEPASEVIVPPITDCGGVMPVALLGCVPVACDCDPRTYNSAAEYMAPLVSERTRAILVAHIGGDAVDMTPILALAEKHGLWVIEDCAQAHGTRYQGRPVGTFGHIAAFSTMSGKHHCTGGQGGVVFTRDEDLYWRARRFADRGKPFNLEGAAGNVVAGLNCNMSDLAAAIGLAQLRRLPDIVSRRVAVGDAVRDALRAHDIAQVGWQVEASCSSYWFLRIALRLEGLTVGKEDVCRALAAEGIPNAVHYRHIPVKMPWFQHLPQRRLDASERTAVPDLPNAEAVTARSFNVGIHENYGEREVAQIVQAIRKVCDAYRV